MNPARAVIAAAGAALLAAPWLPWYGPAGEFLVLFGAVDRLDPVLFEARSAWQRLPGLAIGLTAVGLAALLRAARPGAVGHLDLPFAVAVAACALTTAMASAWRPRADVDARAFQDVEVALRPGAWVALASLAVLLVALAQALRVARRASRLE